VRLILGHILIDVFDQGRKRAFTLQWFIAFVFDTFAIFTVA
jgi:hypothetical protein